MASEIIEKSYSLQATTLSIKTVSVIMRYIRDPQYYKAIILEKLCLQIIKVIDRHISEQLDSDILDKLKQYYKCESILKILPVSIETPSELCSLESGKKILKSICQPSNFTYVTEKEVDKALMEAKNLLKSMTVSSEPN